MRSERRSTNPPLRGDEGALFRRYGDWLVRVTRLRLQCSQELAEDAAAHAWVQLCRTQPERAEHISDTVATYEDGLPEDDTVIAEALDPPIVHDPEPTDDTPPTELPDAYLDRRRRAAQRLAVGVFQSAEGTGFDRLREAQSLALQAAAELRA